jgi:predicted DCC family thiol-disulfide oxidoreductase YuxK
MRPLLIFDGECAFCRYWIERWRILAQGRIDVAAFQDVANRFPEIPAQEFERAVQLVTPDGRVRAGAEAVAESLRTVPGWGWLARAHGGVPGVAPVSAWGYRLVATHRQAFSRLTRIFCGWDGR